MIKAKEQIIKSDTKLCSYWDYLRPGSYWTAECHNCKQPARGTSEFCPGCGLRNEGTTKTVDESRVLKEAISLYGADAQMDICIEEMSELTKSILKWRRYGTEKERDSIKEEIADVKNVMKTMNIIWGNTDLEECAKILRLAEEMKNKYAKTHKDGKNNDY